MQHTTPTVGATIKAFNITLVGKKTSNITLEYTMRKHLTKTSIFLNTNTVLSYLYGLNKTKDFFVGKLKSIRRKFYQYIIMIMKKITAFCKEFSNKCSSDANKN